MVYLKKYLSIAVYRGYGEGNLIAVAENRVLKGLLVGLLLFGGVSF